MKKWLHSTHVDNLNHLEDISGMSDVRGRKVKVEEPLSFSFYYSARNSSHGPRVKISPTPNKLKISQTSSLKLSGDWELFSGKSSERISNSIISDARTFFRKYLVLFLLVWDGLAEDEPSLGDYIEGDISLSDFIQGLEFYDDYQDDLDNVKTVKELEQFCRTNHLVNFYGN